ALLRRRPAEIDGRAFLFATFLLGALMLAPCYGRGSGAQRRGTEPAFAGAHVTGASAARSRARRWAVRR
ncbi:hypothetical protein ACWCO6_30065, partial [Streptomyces sp. NPDC001809]